MPFNRRRGGSQMMMRGATLLGMLLEYGPVALWPLWETSGTNAEDLSGDGFDATYVNTPTLAGDTFAGYASPTFNAAQSEYVQLPAASLETVLKPENADFEMTMVLAIKMTQALWQDANPYGGIHIGVDANNFFAIEKIAANGLYMRGRVGGGTAINNAYTVVSGDWGQYLLFALTADKALNRMTRYTKTSSNATAFPSGTWTATAMTDTFCHLADIAGGNLLTGSLAMAALYDFEWSAAQYNAVYNRIKDFDEVA